MKFTKTPPKRPGCYAWRSGPDGIISAEHLDAEDLEQAAEKGGEWCRLVPADEIQRAWMEGYSWTEYTTVGRMVAWNDSRAKRVMEGRE